MVRHRDFLNVPYRLEFVIINAFLGVSDNLMPPIGGLIAFVKILLFII